MSLPPAVSSHLEARSVLVPAQRRLRDAGSDSAALDARLLLGLVLGRDDAVLPHETLVDWTAEQEGAFTTCLLYTSDAADD